MKIILLTHDQVSEHWSVINGFLSKAIDYGQGESTTTDYLRKVLNNQAHCWAVIDEERNIVGAGLTQFINYAQHTTLHVISFSGDDFENQSKVFETVEQFARDAGCKSIEQWGRKGWAKLLPKYVPGFKEVYTVMRKDL